MKFGQLHWVDEEKILFLSSRLVEWTTGNQTTEIKERPSRVGMTVRKNRFGDQCVLQRAFKLSKEASLMYMYLYVVSHTESYYWQKLLIVFISAIAENVKINKPLQDRKTEVNPGLNKYINNKFRNNRA